MSNDDQISECLKHLKTDLEKVYFLDELIRKLNISVHLVAALGRRKMAEDIATKISDLEEKKSQIYNNK
jgi:hypothetical protein